MLTHIDSHSRRQSGIPSSQSNQSDKSQRRLSRITPSEFDSVLSSNTTKTLVSLDESKLGASQGGNSPRLGSPAGSPSGSPNPEAGGFGRSPSTERGETIDQAGGGARGKAAELATNRLSMYRTPGTATSPDLASLVRKAKAANGGLTPVMGSPESFGSLDVGDTTGAAVAGADTPTTAGEFERSYPNSTSPIPAQPPTAVGSDPLTPSTRQKPLPTPLASSSLHTRAPATSESADATNLARRQRESAASAASALSSSSYVHVPVPPGLANSPVVSATPPRPEPVVSSISPPRPSSSAGTKPSPFGGSPARSSSRPSTAQSDTSRSSFSSSMRNKTSRFFKKFGGGASSGSEGGGPVRPHLSNSASSPNTPIYGSFSSDRARGEAPPLPNMPAAYHCQNNRPPYSTSPDPSASQSSADLTRRPSVDITISPPKSRTSASPADSPTVNGNTAGPKASRRRSQSLNSAASAGAALGAALSSALNGGGSTAERALARRQAAKAEEDRMKKDMQRWKLDLDGVLGGIGESAPKLSPSYSNGRVPHQSRTPVLGMPEFSPLEAAWAQRSPRSSPDKHRTSPKMSTSPAPGGKPDPSRNPLCVDDSPSRRPSWNAPTTASSAVKTRLPEPTVTARSASLPGPTLQPARAEPEAEAPTIRLVSPKPSGENLRAQASQEEDNGQPKEDQTEPANNGGSPATSAVGLGLATIAEGQTKDNTPSNSPRPATPTTSVASQPIAIPVPPLVVIQPLSANLGSVSSSPTTSPIAARRQVVRQSVVGLPGGKFSLSQNTSTTSLQSSILMTDEPTAIIAARPDLASTATLQEKAEHLAQRCWDEDATFLQPKKIAEWLGRGNELNVAVLKVYIAKLDFTGLKLDQAFRRLCEKLYLKAESQQLDRILEQFGRRYWECNLNTVYSSADAVHAVSYSLLMLNTDLHVVNHANRMTQAQFIDNTMSVVKSNQAASAAAQDELANMPNPSLLFGPGTPQHDDSPAPSVFGGDSTATTPATAQGTPAPSTPQRRPMDRRMTNASMTSVKDAVSAAMASAASLGSLTDGATPSRPGNRSRSGSTINNQQRRWEQDLESALKEVYQSIKRDAILQPASSQESPETRPSLNLPGAGAGAGAGSPYNTWGGMGRNGSRRSMTPSSTASLSAGTANSKRASVRGFGSFLGATSSSMELTRSSSPTPSTATSFSDDPHHTNAFTASIHHQNTIGFAHSLSHTIIREQQEDEPKVGEDDDAVSLSDDDLALLGAPWAKEGLLQRKHYWETNGKRAKERNWIQAFVVVSAGQLRMFQFDGSGTSSRGGPRGGGMGGGDWTSNASNVGEVPLTHALASVMPPPGYSRERPHCFVLSLPGGATYFLQAGTQDLVGEWVATCNYWAARLSREPLAGGISNMEYGWNRCLAPTTESAAPQTVSVDEDVMSIRSGKSGKSTLSRHSNYPGTTASGHSPWHNQPPIIEWMPPSVPPGASSLPEENQLEALRKYLGVVRVSYAEHQALQGSLAKLYAPRTPSGTKAMGNWKRKSAYLLSECVKYQTYVDALQSAVRLKNLRRGQKEVEEMLAAADEVDVELDEREMGPVEEDELTREEALAKHAEALRALESGPKPGPVS